LRRTKDPATRQSIAKLLAETELARRRYPPEPPDPLPFHYGRTASEVQRARVLIDMSKRLVADFRRIDAQLIKVQEESRQAVAPSKRAASQHRLAAEDGAVHRVKSAASDQR